MLKTGSLTVPSIFTLPYFLCCASARVIPPFLLVLCARQLTAPRHIANSDSQHACKVAATVIRVSTTSVCRIGPSVYLFNKCRENEGN